MIVQPKARETTLLTQGSMRYPTRLRALDMASSAKNYLLSPLARWALFVASVGGLIGKKLIMAIAWHLNNSRSN